MKKLSINTFLPEKGEIMKFAEVYGKPAGEGMSKWVTFGGRDKTANPVSICLELEPFETTETKFLVSASSLYASLMGPRMLIVSTKPFALAGDPENLAEKEYGYGKSNDSLLFFVNDEDAPPQGIVTTTKWVGKKQIQVEVDQGQWLKPHTKYYVHFYRIGGVFGESRNTPMSLYVVGTDDPERGGEVILEAEALKELPSEGNFEELKIGDRTGLVLWDE